MKLTNISVKPGEKVEARYTTGRAIKGVVSGIVDNLVVIKAAENRVSKKEGFIPLASGEWVVNLNDPTFADFC